METWNWDLYLKTAEQLFKGGYPVGLPMGQTSDAVDWVGALFRGFGSVFIDEKDKITVDSAETRTGARIRGEADGVQPARTSTPGTTPATTAGSSPARARAS